MQDARVDKWAKWVSGPIHVDITTLHGNRATWRLTNDVVRRNGKNLPPSHLFDLLAESYAHSQALAVRRQVDRDSRVVSLGRLLHEIGKDPERLTIDHYTGLHPPEMKSLAADLWIKKFGRPGQSSIDAGRVRRDLRHLEQTSAQVRSYVDKHVAHYDRKPLSELPTFRDLNRSVDYLGKLLKKYRLLLTATTLIRVTPTPQYDVFAIFREPWLPAPMKVRRRREP